jgi:hypothetical protein
MRKYREPSRRIFSLVGIWGATMGMAISAVCTLASAGCGGKGPVAQPATTAEPVDPPPQRTELEIRRDAACDALAPKLTACAIADARSSLPPEKLAELDPDKLAQAHSEEFLADCKSQSLSSRQVRVYEVCVREESECDALVTCLENVRPASAELAETR